MKISKIEYENRIITVQNWIIEGIPAYTLEDKIKKKWDIQIRQARRYIHEAFHRWKKDKDISIEVRRDTRIAELQQMILNMDQKFKKTPKGIAVMLSVKKEISKLEALYPAHKIELQNPIKIHTSPFISEKDENDYKEYLENKYKPKQKST